MFTKTKGGVFLLISSQQLVPVNTQANTALQGSLVQEHDSDRILNQLYTNAFCSLYFLRGQWRYCFPYEIGKEALYNCGYQQRAVGGGMSAIF